MGDAGGVEVRCYLDSALVGTSTIPLVAQEDWKKYGVTQFSGPLLN